MGQRAILGPIIEDGSVWSAAGHNLTTLPLHVPAYRFAKRAALDSYRGDVKYAVLKQSEIIDAQVGDK